MRRLPFCFVLVGFAFATNLISAQEAKMAGNVPPSSAPAASADEPRAITNNGQTFVLAHSESAAEVQTENYVLQRETMDDWKQMITYQRIRLSNTLGADEYVALLQKHLQRASPGSRMRVVQLGKAASVFGVQYNDPEGANPEIALACACFPDAKEPTQLHLINYSAKPAKMADGVLELQIKSWQSRFQSQASALNAKAGSQVERR